MKKTFFLSLLMALSLKVVAESIDTIPERGELGSQVKVVMYGDYQCPFSARGNKTINEMSADIRNDFSFSMRHFPLEFHEHARYAHKGSICAKEQGKFWEMHDALFNIKYGSFNPKTIDGLVTKLDLNLPAFKKCMTSKEAEAILNRDMEEAKKLKISATPTFVIIGPKGQKILAGAYPAEEFKKAMKEVLD
ncbi:hypothetical protein DOM21_13670 [Bacteriovorax stolpii]|uniref:DsbA family protein n=1 Tax=Bacteriovorax stolpii TaxID=960 RepID=UPI0011585B24|nr:DsbA family protein [Bacteriovorax stolpii]QDK42476.1 hypothetical protein DOM21_13670 [Bacteriovorax stolpii]